MSVKLLIAFAALLSASCVNTPPLTPLADAAGSQTAWATACQGKDGWDEPGPPFRVYGQTYYVGTCGIAAILVAGPRGHVLIDSGTDKGAEIVLTNIRALGFDPRDVRTILMSHEHYDHVGGMARLQTATGATIVTSAQAAAVLRSGTPDANDPQAASGHPAFAPVTGNIVLANEGQQLGGRFAPLFTPGHSPGAMSWWWHEAENGEWLTINYIDSLSAISADGYRYSDHPEYVARYRAGLNRVAVMGCGLLLTPHPSASEMRKRILNGGLREDRTQCSRYAAERLDQLENRLAAEAKGG